jgi:predicted Zn finger-like uncharacterized protein
MTIRINCPACNTPNTIDDDKRGGKVRCRKCEEPISVPIGIGSKNKRKDDEAVQETRKVTVKTAAARTRANDDDGGMEPDDKRPRKKARAAKSGLPMVLVLGAGAAVLLFCVAGVVGLPVFFYFLRSKEVAALDKAADQVAQVDQKKPDNNNLNQDKKNPNQEDPKAKKNPDPHPIIDPNPGKLLPDQMAPETVARVKEATVYLRVTMPGGQAATGSGFFVFEPGIVVTNAHVLGMLRSSSRPPTRVDVILNSGLPTQRNLVGEVLGVDRDCDLAVVRVPNDGNLPKGLTLGNDKDLVELQKVFIFGFPYGEKLGKNISVNPSAITSFRPDEKTGQLEKIQVNGGMHPGNSGGPVVNTLGNLVGVSVSVIMGTQINFAVPSEKVRLIMEGRLADTKWGEAYSKAGQPRLPVEYKCLDPLNRIRDMRVEIWTGMPGQQRPHSFQQPLPALGDSPRQNHAAVYQNGVATLDVPLPQLPPGQVFWLQPVLTTAKGAYWGPAQPTSTTLSLVERKPANLTINLTGQKERTAKMNSRFTMMLATNNKKIVTVENTLAELLEVLQPPEIKPGMRTTQIKSAYGALAISVNENGKNVIIPNHIQAQNIVRTMPPVFVVDDTNTAAGYVTVSLKDGHPLKNLVTEFNGMVHNPFEATTFRMPNRVVQPMEKFASKSSMMLRSTGPKRPGQKATIVDLMLTCTYEGTRMRNGREEALITVAGNMEGRDNLKGKLDGNITGKIGFDLAGGFISLAKIKIAADTDENIPGLGSLTQSIAQDIDLDRAPGNPLNLALAIEKQPDPGPIAKGKILINLNGILALTDPIDPTPRGRQINARMKAHPLQMQAGKTYVIAMNSNAVDSYLRLENPQGQTIAEDDDGGGFPNARIVHRCTQTGLYRIIATTFDGKTGPYQLIVQEAGGPNDNPKGGDNPPKGGAFIKPAKSANPTNYMKVVSSKGDFIGQGKSYDYRGDQMVVKRTQRGLNIAVDGWNLDIGAPNGMFLQVGEFPGAKRFAFSDNSPGLDFYGKGRGSNRLAGEFVVWELEFDGDRVVRVAIDFVQRCEERMPPLHGKIRINSSLQ